jgi:hypothetical protein
MEGQCPLFFPCAKKELLKKSAHKSDESGVCVQYANDVINYNFMGSDIVHDSRNSRLFPFIVIIHNSVPR